MNSAKFINFVSVLQSPSNVVPSLSDDETYTIIVDSIRAYLEQEINLETFVDISSKIKLFSGLKENVHEDISAAIARLTSLSAFLNKEQDKSDDINAILIDALDCLSGKK